MNNKILIIVFSIVMLVVGFKLITEHNVPQDNKTSYLTAKNDSEVINQMATVCRMSFDIIDGATEEDCGQLIDELDSRGYEVLSDRSGIFWTERGYK